MDVVTHIGLTHYLVISAMLFAFGLFAVVTRKNAIVILMGVELMLNAANINFLAFSKYNGGMEGVMFSLFVIVWQRRKLPSHWRSSLISTRHSIR